MGQYNSAIITNNGLALVASAISGGGTINFTAVKTSSYAYPTGTNIAGLTDLQDIVQTVEPYSAEVFNETMLQVSALFDNDEVATAYYINTIGLYAKIGSGDPVLFSVCQAVTPDQMPQHSDVSPSSFIYNIQTTVQQASQISVSTNPAGTATQQDILRLEEEKVDIDGGPVENTVVTFDDSGEVEGISTFQDFLDTIVSGIKIGTFFKNFVAGAKFILHTGSIINNLTTNDPEKVLSAAMGKSLQDQLTQLNSDLDFSVKTLSQTANVAQGTFTGQKFVSSPIMGTIIASFNSVPINQISFLNVGGGKGLAFCTTTQNVFNLQEDSGVNQSRHFYICATRGQILPNGDTWGTTVYAYWDGSKTVFYCINSTNYWESLDDLWQVQAGISGSFFLTD